MSKKIFEILKSVESISQIADLKYWPFARMYCYYKLENGKQRPAAKEMTWKWFYLSLKNANLHKLFRKNECLYVYSQRYAGGKEMYLDNIRQRNSGKTSVSIAFSQEGSFTGNHSFLDIAKLWVRLHAKLFSYITPSLTNEKILVKSSPAEANITTTFLKKLRIEFYLWLLIYRLILMVVQPREVYVVGGIYFSPLFYAAKGMGIKTIEVQHGVINKYHPAYNFNKKNDGFFAQDLYLFSSFWTGDCEYPDGTNLYVLGNAYLSKRRYRRSGKDIGILIISSDVLFEEINEFADMLNGAILTEEAIYIKTHPKTSSKQVAKAKIKHRNIKFLENTEDLFSVVSDCRLIISAPSTMVYEFLDCGIPVVVIDFGQEYFCSLKHRCFLGELSIQELRRTIDIITKLPRQEHDNIGQVFFEEFRWPPVKVS